MTNHRNSATEDIAWMDQALAQARLAAAAGEVPVGAVLVDGQGKQLAATHNQPIAHHDGTAHAEMLALRYAMASLENYRLPANCTLYVTLEPCTMCAAALSFARLARLVFAAEDKKGGAVVSGVRFYQQPTCHWRPEVTGGIKADEASALLKDFFRQRRR